jgi:hypothetical protein
MPQPCTVCQHESRDEIDRSLVEGTPNRVVARQHGLHHDAVRRHREDHLPAKLVRAKENRDLTEADALMRRMLQLEQSARRILGKAEASGDLRTALSGIREARSTLELLAKVAGELDERPVVNVLISPTVQTIILQALAPYPDAKLAVASALKELPGE